MNDWLQTLLLTVYFRPLAPPSCADVAQPYRGVVDAKPVVVSFVVFGVPSEALAGHSSSIVDELLRVDVTLFPIKASTLIDCTANGSIPRTRVDAIASDEERWTVFGNNTIEAE